MGLGVGLGLGPGLVFLARLAYLSVLRVSSNCACAGETWLGLGLRLGWLGLGLG